MSGPQPSELKMLLCVLDVVPPKQAEDMFDLHSRQAKNALHLHRDVVEVSRRTCTQQ